MTRDMDPRSERSRLRLETVDHLEPCAECGEEVPFRTLRLRRMERTQGPLPARHSAQIEPEYEVWIEEEDVCEECFEKNPGDA